MISHHKWYTLSGMISRIVAPLAVKWAESPNDLFPVAVFIYGMVELFGLRRSIKVIMRFHAKQTAKIRKRTRKHVNTTPANHPDIFGA